MKGAAMKMGQLASFIDTDYLPDEYRELYQEKLGTLRTSAPPMPWEKVRKVLDQEYDEPYEELFERIEPEAVRGRFDRAGAPRRAARRPRGRGQDPVPGHRRRDPRRPVERGMILRLRRRSPPASTPRRSPPS